MEGSDESTFHRQSHVKPEACYKVLELSGTPIRAHRSKVLTVIHSVFYPTTTSTFLIPQRKYIR